MVRKHLTALSLFLVGCSLGGCVGSDGLTQSFQAQLPVEGMITFSD